MPVRKKNCLREICLCTKKNLYLSQLTNKEGLPAIGQRDQGHVLQDVPRQGRRGRSGRSGGGAEHAGPVQRVVAWPPVARWRSMPHAWRSLVTLPLSPTGGALCTLVSVPAPLCVNSVAARAALSVPAQARTQAPYPCWVTVALHLTALKSCTCSSDRSIEFMISRE